MRFCSSLPDFLTDPFRAATVTYFYRGSGYKEHNRETYRRMLRDTIGVAKKTLDISAYLVTDAALRDAILRAHQDRGVKIRILFDEHEERAAAVWKALASARRTGGAPKAAAAKAAAPAEAVVPRSHG